MQYYELTCLVSSDFSEDEAKDLSNKISDFIIGQKGIIKNTTGPSRKKLGYSIKKRNEAYLITLNFQFEPESKSEELKKLNEKLKHGSKILRYTILSKKETKEKPLSEKKQARKLSFLESKIKEDTTKPTTKVELKEIDKKIEEILSE